MDFAAFRGVIGIFVLLAIAYGISKSRKDINFRTVGFAFLLQLLLGAFVLYVPFGKDVLTTITSSVQSVIDSAKVGINFLFGGLGTDAMYENGVGFVFAVRVLPNIIFFSSLIAVLYYLGIMQWVIKIIGGSLQKLLKTSKPESLSATANIFVGQTEAPLVVRPYIAKMTQSELFAIMVGGLASVAGSIMAGYAGLGIELKYLIAASFMAAPGGLLMAKIICPETEPEKIVQDSIDFDEGDEKPANVIDAAASGAASGLKLAVNVGAMLLAFIALIALLNTIVGGISGLFGYDNITIELILGYVFAPFAFIIGVPVNEMLQAGSFIGQKVVVNEFFAYVNFVEIKDTLSPVTQAIVTFALCGFANLSSIAILLGGIGSMAPSRRRDIARLGMHAMLAATLANLMSAAIAGVFISL
ncbi:MULTISPECIES: NupC/NupG family nucleoside CNT transporter [unclassified Colwellia]|jgi:CNT family concentrative nucleoside transporter|uniref:NupC/NupG family nucleoside CNT transporter n=1 Tax=unclassified Colwellia TaxID=196834 RepID=UPI0015F53404|nr:MULTISPECIES: NupC/NupG family nucleoside CNT transporter [unclassified Colwellia]MBA6338593.1 NupC/NupG family nucleoside CNT transporter [Colwellia sp. BRX8-7]MBA6346554.1 NupC/NupG family nucleoside CNT transporter [Colwellia sp. BRX8-9]MBA6353387.1 NupC/NupG family nucleoside CNT transporter [Colwellia sp. BRX9-1]MBA6355701.1 NupC/NupG family nucleoside CNT transporter [Colwellia sp. BRX8-3]MBA6361878.1 NupC/NupG family nucleoside CNT transporter [Colwellia sp. BRX8-6]